MNVVLDPNGDEDGDGLINGQELTLGTDPYQKDTDGDGASDSVEVVDGTDPNDAGSYNSLRKTGQVPAITKTFGSGTNQFSIDFVTIGNPGNPADTTGHPNPVGSVGYVYYIGKYEVSRGVLEKANAAGGLGIGMWDMQGWGFGSNGPKQPATGMSWFSIARFVNYLNTSTGYHIAYKFDANNNFQPWTIGEPGFNASHPYRNSLAKYVIPDSDEWYKAAYGSPGGAWFNYATGSDAIPNPVTNGTNSSTAVYNQWIHSGPAAVDDAGGLSAFGTMAQTGNVWEFTETHVPGPDDPREVRGGQWTQPSTDVISSSYQHVYAANGGHPDIGFRIAMVPVNSAALTNGLVGKYTFDDGTANDSSGHDNNGISYNTDVTSGIQGLAFKFNGTNSLVKINTLIPRYTTEGTIFGWYKANSAPNTNHISIYGNIAAAYQTMFGQNRKADDYAPGLFLTLWNKSEINDHTYSPSGFTYRAGYSDEYPGNNTWHDVVLEPQPAVPFSLDGSWHSIAVTIASGIQGKTLKLFFNGNLVGETNIGSPQSEALTNAEFFIGGSAPVENPRSSFDGDIDNV
ncbi:MAG: hypothetical protein EBS53_15520, partial [Bacteroidetes bacterium]|nr:hypothetical protein [Bacteroidota bacterium]